MDKLAQLEHLIGNKASLDPVFWEGMLRLLEIKENCVFPTQTVSKGEIIFDEGDTGDVAYAIQQGEVHIMKRHGNHVTTLSVLRDNDFFGEMALIDGKPRSASAVATTDTVLIVVSREQFIHRLEQYDPMLKCIMKRLVEVIRRLDDALCAN